ncbi:MAG: kynureninase [Candidatus Aminicenantes bacterium]|nr:kynureninase [Candidatus Aminicenantes bacterium]
MRGFELSEDFALKLDREDPLVSFRSRFFIPPNTIYFDGNSLGLMSKDSEESLTRVIKEWQEKGINGWLDAEQPWFYFAEALGAAAAELVGAEADEVVAAASTTVNIHSLVSSFYKPAGRRKKILADELNFPSDIYALKGQIALRGLNPEENLVLVQSRDGKILDEKDIVNAMDGTIALALFPSVLYRSGQLLDMESLARKAQKKGIIIGFDCCHSVGAIPHRFDEWDVDFALWCSYKYMNSGPGSPAFLYVNRKHFNEQPLLAGWFGCDKEKQFNMTLDFCQVNSAGAWQISTPGILGLAPLEGSLKILREAGIERIREKSLRMTAYLFFLVENVLSGIPYRFGTATPKEPERRGGHVALQRNEDAWSICQALKARGIIPDFRPPDIIRIAPVALYNKYHEIWQMVNIIKSIIDNKDYLSFKNKKAQVT